MKALMRDRGLSYKLSFFKHACDVYNYMDGQLMWYTMRPGTTIQLGNIQVECQEKGYLWSAHNQAGLLWLMSNIPIGTEIIP